MKLRLNHNLRTGLVMLGMFVVASSIGPVLLGIDPIEVDFAQTLLPPGPGHWLGTDDLGRDVLARVLAAARWTCRSSRCACSCRS